MSTSTTFPPCPTCGSTEAIRIAYGYPDFELWQAEERGEIVLGGCVIGPESPDYECRRCGAGLPWVDPEASRVACPAVDRVRTTRATEWGAWSAQPALSAPWFWGSCSQHCIIRWPCCWHPSPRSGSAGQPTCPGHPGKWRCCARRSSPSSRPSWYLRPTSAASCPAQERQTSGARTRPVTGQRPDASTTRESA